MTTAPPLPWHDALDQEHADLRQHAADLMSDLQDGVSAQDLEVQFVLLRARARAHWATEERVMAQAGYPAGPAHAAEHAALGGALAAAHQLFLHHGPCKAVVEDLGGVLARWFGAHGEGPDAELMRWLAGPGRAAARG